MDIIEVVSGILEIFTTSQELHDRGIERMEDFCLRWSILIGRISRNTGKDFLFYLFDFYIALETSRG